MLQIHWAFWLGNLGLYFWTFHSVGGCGPYSLNPFGSALFQHAFFSAPPFAFIQSIIDFLCLSCALRRAVFSDRPLRNRKTCRFLIINPARLAFQKLILENRTSSPVLVLLLHAVHGPSIAGFRIGVDNLWSNMKRPGLPCAMLGRIVGTSLRAHLYTRPAKDQGGFCFTRPTSRATQVPLIATRKEAGAGSRPTATPTAESPA